MIDTEKPEKEKRNRSKASEQENTAKAKKCSFVLFLEDENKSQIKWENSSSGKSKFKKHAKKHIKNLKRSTFIAVQRTEGVLLAAIERMSTNENGLIYL